MLSAPGMCPPMPPSNGGKTRVSFSPGGPIFGEMSTNMPLVSPRLSPPWEYQNSSRSRKDSLFSQSGIVWQISSTKTFSSYFLSSRPASLIENRSNFFLRGVHDRDNKFWAREGKKSKSPWDWSLAPFLDVVGGIEGRGPNHNTCRYSSWTDPDPGAGFADLSSCVVFTKLKVKATCRHGYIISKKYLAILYDNFSSFVILFDIRIPYTAMSRRTDPALPTLKQRLRKIFPVWSKPPPLFHFSCPSPRSRIRKPK